MAVFKRGKVWWYEFIFAGKRIRESAKTTSKTVAKEAEKGHRRELERTLAGLPAEKREYRILLVSEVVARYRKVYEATHPASSLRFSKPRLDAIVRVLGNKLLPDLTEDAIHDYIGSAKMKVRPDGPSTWNSAS